MYIRRMAVVFQMLAVSSCSSRALILVGREPYPLHLAQGAFVMLICALAESERPESPVGGFDADVPVLTPGPGGGTLE